MAITIKKGYKAFFVIIMSSREVYYRPEDILTIFFKPYNGITNISV